MKKDVARALYAQGFGALARAYRTSYEKLAGLDIDTIDVHSLDFSTVSAEQCNLIDVVKGVEFLALYLDDVTHVHKQQLDASARRLLDNFAGVPVDFQSPRFDPEFELSTLLRFIALTQDAITA